MRVVYVGDAFLLLERFFAATFHERKMCLFMYVWCMRASVHIVCVDGCAMYERAVVGIARRS